MNDNGLPFDPLSAAQFGKSPFSKFEITLTKDRKEGENFSEIRGTSFFVLTADYPVYAEIVGGDLFPLVPGQTYRGDFSGLKLVHPAYTGNNDTRLVLIVSHLSSMIDPTQWSSKRGLNLPYTDASANPNIAVNFPAFKNSPDMDIKLMMRVSNAATPENVLITAQYFNSSAIVVIPGFVQNNVTFNGVSNNYLDAGLLEFKLLNGTNYFGVANLKIAAFNGCDRVRISGAFSVAPTAFQELIVRGTFSS